MSDRSATGMPAKRAARSPKNDHKTMKHEATVRYLRMTPRKTRAVANLISGLSAVEAEAQLMHERRRPAKPLLKLLRSAMASARTAKRVDVERLYVDAVRVDQGTTLKRYLPRARGIATPLHKRSCHVRLVLAERPDAGPARFTIVVPKKVKRQTDERKKDRKKQPTERAREARSDESQERAREKPGFFRKFFRRKSV